jgi:hypothetical protein
MHHTPCTIHHTPYPIHHTLYIIYDTKHHTSRTLHPTPHTMHPTPSASLSSISSVAPSAVVRKLASPVSLTSRLIRRKTTTWPRRCLVWCSSSKQGSKSSGRQQFLARTISRQIRGLTHRPMVVCGFPGCDRRGCVKTQDRLMPVL